MFNKIIILIGRLGQNAEAKPLRTITNTRFSTSPRTKAGKNEEGEHETRNEWHRVYAWSNLFKFVRTLQKGQLVTLEGTLKYREVTEEVEGNSFKHSLTEIHARSLKRLSKVEAADDPSDGASEE